MPEIQLTYYGRITPSGLLIRNRKVFDAELQQFCGKDVELIVRRKRRIRTNAQNRYLHLLITIFSDKLFELTGTRIATEELKESLKAKFTLRDLINEQTGEVIMQVIAPTSKMTTTELNYFIENIIEYAATEFHITLPYPNEQFTLDYN